MGRSKQGPSRSIHMVANDRWRPQDRRYNFNCEEPTRRRRYEGLICGLGGTLGAGLEEFFYFLDVPRDVNAYGIVGRFDHVHVETIF